ncbi:uncharacterized protein F4822DRAFT_227611 [Hypoxylon trugodes]|uniref:uncharacterized protein n=1 Tax=Hypoxylon trugodes TaxID=326681 RepID=UPI00218D20C8|nr:uncharacterized protein F4822DRAFT_227611 [Hypoxylon trugodes]KAI1390175.1 hypothetical protein F4822DRAFT_227611 [Hypoxylon trugodes]
MDLIVNLICEKEARLSSRRYRYRDTTQESTTGKSRQRRGYQDWTGRSVYPHDGEDIKAHKWFRDIPWDRLQYICPPFVPQLSSREDTHYFDEEEPISDWSESQPETSSEIEDLAVNPLIAGSTATGFGGPQVPRIAPIRSPAKIAAMQTQMAMFPRHLRGVLGQFISTPYDSARLKRIDREIEAMAPDVELCDAMKAFVRMFGRRERKRPRDRLLRDRNTRGTALEVRKQTAFMGYTYRRMRDYNAMGMTRAHFIEDGGSKGKARANDSAELASYRAWCHARAG